MLSTNSTSSIQSRRQTHRRQQSLEVPILATPLPANPRHRNRPGPQGHRRGLSLDQSLSGLISPSGFRPLLPQDQGHTTGTPPVRIHLDITNIQPPEQHHVQETQQHSTDQPGHLAQDFNTNLQQQHLQQHLNGTATPTIVAPTPTQPNQEQALQELQKHLEWYQQQYGHSPVPAPQSEPVITISELPADLVMMPAHAQMAQQQQTVSNNVPQTPVSHGHAKTVPNTPQHYTQPWPSPPPTHAKHVRSQSFQYDVAPMSNGYDEVIQAASSPCYQQQQNFPHDSFNGSDAGYASSVYTSSIMDPMSPSRQNTLGGMPTVFEEPSHGDCFSSDVLLQATVGASDDFNSPNFIVGGMMGGMSPRTAMLHNLGEDVNATIVETGVPSEQVDMYISNQDPHSKGWTCMFMESDTGKPCGKFFKRKENARSHVQNHLGDRQFQCNDCGKTFVRQHDMKRHAAIHKDDRPHICPCGSGFARHDALTRHRQRGMCSGALPGYEKREEDKPKRGRPKKERPDMETRTTKSKKARTMDRQTGAAGTSYAGSSHSSVYSTVSLPTPSDSSDYIDPDAFINLAQTPPTSPPSPQKSTCISPAALMTKNEPISFGGSFNGGSSPENGPYEDFNFGAVEAEPGVAQQNLFSEDPFSPAYSSIPASSPPAGDGVQGILMSAAADMVECNAWGDVISPMGAGEGSWADMLDRWIAAQ